VLKYERKRGRYLNARRLSSHDNDKKNAGRVVYNNETIAVIEPPVVPAFDRRVLKKGFTIQDILWAIGIWSVLLTMSPVIFFYMLMVA